MAGTIALSKDGALYDIPADKVDGALQAGFEKTQALVKDGATYDIPVSKVQDALKAGFAQSGAAAAPAPEKGYLDKVGAAGKEMKAAAKKSSVMDVIKGDAEVAAHVVSATVAPIPAVLGAVAGEIKDILKTEKGAITVRRPDGTVEKVTGDRNWRNNNPGNLEFGDFAKSLGAIGSDGRFAVFPSYEAGRKAQEKLLFEGKGYAGKNLSAAIGRYAPDSENDTEGYVKAVLAAVGGKNKVMSAYTPEERVKILDAMKKVEGFRAGKAEKVPKTFWERYDAGKEAMTYQPKTEFGKAEAKTVGTVLEPVGRAIGAVKSTVSTGLEAVGVEKETAKHIPDVIEDFIPFKAGKIAKVGAVAAETTGKAGLNLGRKAVETVTSEIPMAARGTTAKPLFIEGTQRAFAEADELGVKLTQGQVKAAGLREAGKVTEANKVLEKEAALAKREPAVANHYAEQAKTVAAKLDELANPKTVSETSKLITPAERKVFADMRNAVVRDEAGNVVSVDARKLSKILEKHEGKLSPPMQKQVDTLLNTARNVSSKVEASPKTFVGQVAEMGKTVLKHKAETAAYAALGITNPVAAGMVMGARYLGGRAKDKLSARNFQDTSKLREVGKTTD